MNYKSLKFIKWFDVAWISVLLIHLDVPVKRDPSVLGFLLHKHQTQFLPLFV